MFVQDRNSDVVIEENKEKNSAINIKKVVLYITILVYIYILLRIIIFKTLVSPLDLVNPYRDMIRDTNLIPFKDIWSQNVSAGINRINIIGNIALFIPMGIYLAMFRNNNVCTSQKIRDSFKSMALVFITSVIIEGFQYIFAIGVADINDVILNLSGGVIGILVYRILHHLFKEKRADSLVVSFGALTMIAVVALDILLKFGNR